MIRYAILPDGRLYRQVSRPFALNAYRMGYDVILCPCGVNPLTDRRYTVTINRDERESLPRCAGGLSREFIDRVALIECCICTGDDTGRNLVYYVPSM